MANIEPTEEEKPSEENDVTQVDDETVEEEEEEYDPYKARTAEENQRTHCDRLGCCYCLVSIAVLYLLMICLACYFIYLGRFSFNRGIAKVKRTFKSITLANLGRVAMGREIIYVD